MNHQSVWYPDCSYELQCWINHSQLSDLACISGMASVEYGNWTMAWKIHDRSQNSWISNSTYKSRTSCHTKPLYSMSESMNARLPMTWPATPEIQHSSTCYSFRSWSHAPQGLHEPTSTENRQLFLPSQRSSSASTSSMLSHETADTPSCIWQVSYSQWSCMTSIHCQTPSASCALLRTLNWPS